MASVNRIISEFLTSKKSGKQMRVTEIYREKSHVILRFKFEGDQTEYHVKFRLENSEEDFFVNRTWQELRENNRLDLWAELPKFKTKSLLGGISGDIIREDYKFVIRKIGVEEFLLHKFNIIINSRMYPDLVEEIIQPLIDDGVVIGIYRYLIQDDKGKYSHRGISSVEVKELKSSLKRKLKAPMIRTWKDFGKDPRRKKAPLDMAGLKEAIIFLNKVTQYDKYKVRYYK